MYGCSIGYGNRFKVISTVRTKRSLFLCCLTTENLTPDLLHIDPRLWVQSLGYKWTSVVGGTFHQVSASQASTQDCLPSCGLGSGIRSELVGMGDRLLTTSSQSENSTQLWWPPRNYLTSHLRCVLGQTPS